MNDVARIRNGLNIRRPKKKANMLNDKRIKACMSRFSSGAYTRMQFLLAMSHAMGAYTQALHCVSRQAIFLLHYTVFKL